MKKEEFADRLSCACASVISAEQELTEIDSHFGDADHGLTMKKIAGAIDSAVKAFEELDGVSGAKVGDKTMMDALIPASEAIAAYEGSDENELFAIAARAAADGAEASRQFVSRFGRAKSYGTQTIGTPDAGAVSMAYFFRGLARA